VEQRRNKRYRLIAPVKFSWTDANGYSGRGEGSTRDISSASVYVLTSSILPEGSDVRMEVILPPLESRKPRVRLRTQGFVVRTEPNGFAAVAEMNFRIHLREEQSRSEDRTKRDTTNFEQMLRLQMQN
jgi:hypothetical protein